MAKSTERFTQTVENYIKYRPHYPKVILQLLIDECNLDQNKIIADIGSGTGFLSKLFLDYGNTVYGVEPNNAMRKAGENYLKNYANFHSVNGTAEHTGLMSKSIDIVTAGTAFHWFNAKASKIEFKRILNSPGWVILIWNVKDITHSTLVKDYENLILKYETDYHASGADQFEKTAIEAFFSPDQMKTKIFANSQILDWEGFRGRLCSTSYILKPEDPNFTKMLDDLKIIFEKHQKNGLVEFLYETKLYYGCLNI